MLVQEKFAVEHNNKLNSLFNFKVKSPSKVPSEYQNIQISPKLNLSIPIINDYLSLTSLNNIEQKNDNQDLEKLAEPVVKEISYQNILLSMEFAKNPKRANNLFNYTTKSPFTKSSSDIENDVSLNTQFNFSIPICKCNSPIGPLNSFEQFNTVGTNDFEMIIEPITNDISSQSISLNTKFAENPNRALSLFNYTNKNIPISSLSTVEQDINIDSKLNLTIPVSNYNLSINSLSNFEQKSNESNIDIIAKPVIDKISHQNISLDEDFYTKPNKLIALSRLTAIKATIPTNRSQQLFNEIASDIQLPILDFVFQISIDNLFNFSFIHAPVPIIDSFMKFHIFIDEYPLNLAFNTNKIQLVQKIEQSQIIHQNIERDLEILNYQPNTPNFLPLFNDILCNLFNFNRSNIKHCDQLANVCDNLPYSPRFEIDLGLSLSNRLRNLRNIMNYEHKDQSKFAVLLDTNSIRSVFTPLSIQISSLNRKNKLNQLFNLNQNEKSITKNYLKFESEKFVDYKDIEMNDSLVDLQRIIKPLKFVKKCSNDAKSELNILQDYHPQFELKIPHVKPYVFSPIEDISKKANDVINRETENANNDLVEEVADQLSFPIFGFHFINKQPNNELITDISFDERNPLNHFVSKNKQLVDNEELNDEVECDFYFDPDPKIYSTREKKASFLENFDLCGKKLNDFDEDIENDLANHLNLSIEISDSQILFLRQKTNPFDSFIIKKLLKTVMIMSLVQKDLQSAISTLLSISLL